MLDRVDRLAVTADQQAEVLAVEVRGHALGVLGHLDLGVDADRVDDLFQHLPHARGGVAVAAHRRRPVRFFFLRDGGGPPAEAPFSAPAAFG